MDMQALPAHNIMGMSSNCNVVRVHKKVIEEDTYNKFI